MMTAKCWRNVILLLLLSSAVSAQLINLTWYTIDGGGGYSTDGAFELEGTAGQVDAVMALTGGGYALEGGYWPGIQPAGVPVNGDCNGDGAVGLADYILLEQCLAGPAMTADPNCVCFDLDQDLDVDVRDISQFQLNFVGDPPVDPSELILPEADGPGNAAGRSSGSSAEGPQPGQNSSSVSDA